MRGVTVDQLREQIRRAHRLWSHVIDPIEMEFGFPRGLMYAIGSRETNLDPYYADHPGDNGYGHGLWQIDKRSHVIPPDWRSNIEWQCRKGAEVLRSCYRKCGAWEGAANCYNSGSCRTSATTHGNYGPDVVERLGWVQRVLDELAPIPAPDPPAHQTDLRMFWHQAAIFLDFHGRISPHGLTPDTVDGLVAAGVRVVGRPGDNSELMRMFGDGLESPPAEPPEYTGEFLERNGWLGDYFAVARPSISAEVPR
jgi:hypothetical protein